MLVTSCAAPPRIEPEEITRIADLESAEWIAWSAGSEGALATIHEALADPSPKVRLAAARMLGRRRSKSSEEPLLTRLDHEEDIATRVEIVRSLGLRALEPDASLAVRARLRELAFDTGLPAESLVALRALGRDAEDRTALEAALSSGDEERELAAALALSTRPDLDCGDALLRRFERGSGQRVRWVTARALLNTLSASDPRRARLAAALDDENALVAAGAMMMRSTTPASASTNPPPDPARGLPVLLSRARDANALGFLRTAAIRALGERLRVWPHVSEQRTQVEDALLDMARVRPAPPETLVAEIWSALAHARTSRAVLAMVDAVNAFRAPLEPSALPPLVGLLSGLDHESDPRLRERALTRAEELARGESPARVAWGAACGRLRSAGLERALADDLSSVRAAALEAVEEIREEEFTVALDAARPELAAIALDRAAQTDRALPRVALEELLVRASDVSDGRLGRSILAWLDSRRDLDPWRELAPRIAERAADGGSPTARALARRILDRLAYLGEVASPSPGTPPGPVLSLGARWDLRRPRLLVVVDGVGEIALELASEFAPHHVSALLEATRRGEWEGGHARRHERVLRLVPPASVPSAHEQETRLIGRELPPERSFERILAGTLFVGPTSPTNGLSLGELSIALEPLPEMEGRATVIGRVLLHERRLESVLDGTRASLAIPTHGR